MTTRIITPLKRVEPDRPSDIDPARDDPLEKRDDLRSGRREDVAKQQNAERGGWQQGAAGDELRAAVADRAAEKAGDDRGDQRQEDDCERQSVSLPR